MFIDARLLPEDTVVATDVCIVGAGPAGITLAREFIGQNFQVCLLESGRTVPDKDIQSLCQGKITEDLPQNLSESRCRQFGGSANLWDDQTGEKYYSARLLPLDKIDFEKRDWLPYSGWPFGKSHLDPFYERAQYLCRLKPFAYDAEDWEDEHNPQLPFAGDRVVTTMYQYGPRDVFTNEIRTEINQSANITTYLNTNVVEIETNETAKTVSRIRVACSQGNKFWLTAKVFILATGGIENARLLLLSNKTQKVGLGNQNDLVGRFFMEHALFRLGLFMPSNRQVFNSTALYDTRWINNMLVMGKLSLTEKIMHSKQLLNSYMLLFPKPKAYESKAVSSLKTIIASSRRAEIPKDALKLVSNVISGIDDTVTFLCGKTFKLKEFSHYSALGGWSRLKDNEKRFGSFEVRACTEQPPNPDIRITLGSELDHLGLRKIQPIRWRWSDMEINSILQLQKLFGEEIAHAGLGQFKSWLELDGGTKPQCVGGHHHMGTTRMHINPKQGVVDENCRVHNVSNLFMAGSSVFPTGGAANPTLTIVALAIRLADHVKKVMGSDAVATIHGQLLHTSK